MKKENGITLIALVITIIVLLILAGISLNMALGNNGIINKAKEAKEKTEIASQNEFDQMDEAAKQIDDILNSEENIAKKIKNNPSEYYGKTISGYECSQSEYNWQIFYSDGKNIYITTTEYVPWNERPNAEQNPNFASDSKTDERNYSGTTDIVDPRIREWLSYAESEYGENDMTAGIKDTAYLLDTSIWSEFKGDKAEYAIGGPTLDMYIASYNDTHPQKYIEITSVQYGYKLKWNTETEYAGKIDGLVSGEFNNLYTLDDGEEYIQWLASPSGLYEGTLITASKEGVGYNYWSYDTGALFRPIVCLSSDVQLEKTEIGEEIEYNIK